MTTQTITFENTEERSKAVAQIVLASLFIAVCATIRIPLPFTPVPLSLQTFAVMLVGGALGSRVGTAAVCLYLVEALLGLPVLSGMRSDPQFLMTPVAGYCIGFVFQAYLVGRISENAKSLGQATALLGYFLASLVTLGCGYLWLSLFVGADRAIFLGVIPFIPGDIIKVSAAAALLKYGAKQG